MIFGSNFKKNKSLVKLIMAFLLSGILVSFVKIDDTNIFYLIDKSFDLPKDISKPYSRLRIHKIFWSDFCDILLNFATQKEHSYF